MIEISAVVESCVVVGASTVLGGSVVGIGITSSIAIYKQHSTNNQWLETC